MVFKKIMFIKNFSQDQMIFMYLIFIGFVDRILTLIGVTISSEKTFVTQVYKYAHCGNSSLVD